ncbi:AN1-like Zinc finger [Ostertagia ostertagi]
MAGSRKLHVHVVCWNGDEEIFFFQVRRHRHPPAPSTCRQRARSKPRITHRERSSSDDNEASQVEPVAFALPVRRGVSTRAVRSMAMRGGAARCNVCAFRINSAFNCRCGKTLCSRHRAAQSHTCSKIRAKLQQVSD